MMLAIILIGAFDTASTKKLQQSMPTDFLGFTNYNLMVAALSTIYFFMINKFQIHINVPTLLYSVLYAAVVFVSLTMPILTMKFVSIPMMLVVRTAGSVIVPSLVSGIFLQENIDLFAALSICLLLSAVLLLYFKSNSMKQKSNLFLCVLLFLISGLGTIVMKFYAIDTRGHRYQLRDRLRDLEDILPSYFIRINKSTLANEHRIARFDAAFSGGVDAVFRCGHRDYVSRRCFAEIRRRYEEK